MLIWAMRTESRSWSVVGVALAGLACLVGCTGTVAEAEGEGGGPSGGATQVPGARGAGQGGGAAGSAGAPAGAAQGGQTGPSGAPSGPASPAGDSQAFKCDATAAPPAQAWRKLTATQYRNTLRDLLTFALKDANQANAVLSAVSGPLGRLPSDERQRLPQDLHGSYRRLDQDVEQLHVDATYEIALGVAAQLTTTARLSTIAGRCATDADASNDAACLTAFVTSFGERALRRPLEASELEHYKSYYGPTAGSDPAGWADAIAGLLVAGPFLYHTEHGEPGAPEPAGSSVFALTGFEVANRLAYQFWDTMPDDALLAAARAGMLKTPEGLAQQVDRLLKDPRSRATFDDFYRDWLKLDDLKPLDTRVGDATFKAFAGLDLPRATLRSQMLDDVVALTRWLTWDRNGTFDELLSTSASTAKGAELARIYGVPIWDGAGPPPELPVDQRPGLLTRAAFLATGSANTRPVMKGVFTRETILCDEIPPPPDNAMANPPELDPKLTTRQVVERITEMPGTACAACHSRFINPIGYATEGYDALGRVRTEQRLFDAKGVEVGRVPVDTRSIPQVVAGDMTESKGAADLMRLIVRSGKAHACFARQYLRFTFARWDDPADGCVLERLRQSLERRAPIAAVLREVALGPEFQRRSFK